jgi:hypothetical protein
VYFDPELEVAAEFLETLAAGGGASNPVIDEAVRILRDVRGALSGIPIPTIAEGPDGMVGMTWENGIQHVNVQVLPDGSVEFFAEDLITRDLWSEETRWEAPLTSGLIEHLKYVY